MPFTANEAVTLVWYMGSGNTGLNGNMTATLRRFPTSSSEEAATETVTIAEAGSGYYTFTFTPTLAYQYHLHVVESTTFQEYDRAIDVSSAPTAATASDAYCSEADAEAWVQMGDWGATDQPTETEVLAFMAMRAAIIYGWMAEVVGSAAPGPSTYSTTIDTGTDAGTALSFQTRMANAIGAAVDALQAAGAGQSPSRSERVAELENMFLGMKLEIQALAVQYTSASTLISNHFTEGRVTVDTYTSATQEGLTFTGREKW